MQDSSFLIVVKCFFYSSANIAISMMKGSGRLLKHKHKADFFGLNQTRKDNKSHFQMMLAQSDVDWYQG